MAMVYVGGLHWPYQHMRHKLAWRWCRCVGLEQRVVEVQAQQAARLGPSQEQAARLQAHCTTLERQLQTLQTESEAFK